ncbi:(2Fe-2S)-binding protein, partial [Promineifilum sp.]|uniref:(2Fe-2S)-binding protein n=1 Tax=Promineifilum sp. TaxID=2664178 RepID=UPI0035B168FD
MSISLHINGRDETVHARLTDTLRDALRAAGYVSVRFGSHSGETGAAAVLVDGQLVSADTLLVGQVAGRHVETIEGLTPGVRELHPIQQAFIETGAIQSGYSTPAMMLAAKGLLSRTPDPTEAQVRDALSGVLCRETGYFRPVQAVLRAAAYLRGEEPPPLPQPEIVDASYLVGGIPDDGRESDELGGPELSGGG